MTSQFSVAEKITSVLAKTHNTAKKLKIDLEKDYPIKVNYTTVWKAKQRAMKELYGDWEILLGCCIASKQRWRRGHMVVLWR
jgi:hypothetical protein